MGIDVTEEHWYAGLTLLERHEALHGGELPIEPISERSRAERWSSSGPFASVDLFDRRLEADGLTRERFRVLVETRPVGRSWTGDTEPEWLRTIASTWDEGRDLEMPFPGGEGENREDQGLVGFLGLVRPLIAGALARFRRGLDVLLERDPDGPVVREVGEAVFLNGLARQVIALIGRTVVLELNVARIAGRLHGDTSDARFRDFVEGLDGAKSAGAAAAQAALFREYPLLARGVMAMLQARVDARLECLRHLCEDWREIERQWPELAGSKLAGVSAMLGDPHRGGRTVLACRFEGGAHLVYKPRSLAADAHFQGLLEWLNARGAAPAFLTIEVLDRGDHGWVEAMPAAPCDTRAAVTRFYERLGGLLAVLYALEATDFHYENLIACGEHPVLVDLESLFHPRAERSGASALPSAAQLAADAVSESVLRVGLLPQRAWSRPGFAGIDLSGCGGAAGQRLPQGVPVWEAVGTDMMRLGEQAGTLPASANRPMFEGRPVDVLEEVGSLERGFATTYRLLCDLRARLLEEGGPIRRFAADRVRAILRPTRMYGLLLQDSTHPDVLRDGLDRDRLLDWLWADVERQPWLARAIAAERHDLECGDIPCFTTVPASRSIWTSAGHEIAHYYECSGLELVERRVLSMGDEDLARQRWFLRASMTSLGLAAGRGGGTAGVARLAAPATPDEFVDAAARVAHRLQTLAFVDQSRASWVGLTMQAEERWALVPLGLDVYGGLPGIALFLARLASVTGNVRHRQLAMQTLASVIEQIEPQRSWPLIGAFSGWGGVIYALAHVGVLLEDERCFASADAIVPRVRELVSSDTALDIVAGAAGAIMGLAALHAVRPSDAIVDAVRACGIHLVDRVEEQSAGCAWRTSLPSSAPLVGFSHGAAGIALALLTAASLTEVQRMRAMALRAIAYERSTFHLPVKNWPDFRLADPGTQPGSSPVSSLSFMTTWCHGAPGVGLGRIAGLRYEDDWRARTEIAEAVKTTMVSGFGGSQCLCHGDLGCVEFLTEAAASLGDTVLRRDVAQMAAGVLRAIDEGGWRCGVPLHVETPGYMMGLAGIGDGLLRFGAPALPCVLMLEAPRPHARVRARPPADSSRGEGPGMNGADAAAPGGGDDAGAPVAARRH